MNLCLSEYGYMWVIICALKDDSFGEEIAYGFCRAFHYRKTATLAKVNCIQMITFPVQKSEERGNSLST